jgi:uncharacterized protein (UPF0261 family)/ABC-type branched-subunit amino acid transport system ATPase component
MTEPENRHSILSVEDLHVRYGYAHVLQGVSLRLDHGVLALVGRNGMGKTTFCNAIMGLVPASGSIRLGGQELVGLPANKIVARGIGYVPQGRRVWPSLSVEEHLRLIARGGKSRWTIERVYETFPHLAERRRNRGAELSGGEQQMLAIARALLTNPRVLVMDEPTEGLAPIIVEQVAGMLKRLSADAAISVLLVEQNLGVAIDIADHVAVMVNGRIARTLRAFELAADADLQQRLMGVRQAAEEEEPQRAAPQVPSERYRVRRAYAAVGEPLPTEIFTAPAGATQQLGVRSSAGGGDAARRSGEPDNARPEPPETGAPSRFERALQVAAASIGARPAYLVGTFDTKGRELNFLRGCLEAAGVRVVTVDVSTSGRPSPATFGPAEVARHHPRGRAAVFTNDRGSAVTAMAEAFEQFILTRRDVGGAIGAGGSGATALVTPGLQRLPVGIPKLMVSTVASGDVRRYVGATDICMMYPVTDVSGINRISEQVLSNAAHALAGMMVLRRRQRPTTKPAIGLTMFGLTTACVQAISRTLEPDYDCVVFHATGTGGQSMEKLADSGLLCGLIDVTTTEIADLHMGGVMSAGEHRLDAVIRTRLPYVGSCGALDMVNFWALETVPEKYRNRNLYKHNPQVTLMRTTPQENVAMGHWIAEKLNRCEGPVRFLIPEGGLSAIDAPGQRFYDPAANRALFAAIEQKFRPTANRKLVRWPHHINDPAFADELVASFREIAGSGTKVAAE